LSENTLLNKISSVAENIKKIPKEEKILIISHYDADGISSGSIIFQLLFKLGFSPHIRIVTQLDHEIINEIKSLNYDYVIFSDMGSGQKSLISSIEGKNIFIIDHHQPEYSELENEINPHYFGFDGAKDISSSGLAYLLAKEIDEKNTYLSQIAIIGALGDLQDRGEKNSLIGLNEKISQDAEKANLLKKKLGLKLHGFESRPIIQCLANTIEPYLPGLTGNEGACLKFIKNLGIDPKRPDGNWKTLSDLSNEEIKLLVSGLIRYLISLGFSSKEAEKIIGTVYIFPNESSDSPLYDAREFSSSINACGRMSKYGLGVAICLGDRSNALNELKQVLQDYKQKLSYYINWLSSSNNSIKILSHVQAIFGGDIVDEKMIAPLISMLYGSKPFSLEKPIIGFSKSKNFVKVSARATIELVNKGINLGALIREAAKKCNGIGGGHNIAAGAQIPIGKEEEFLEYLNKLIKESQVIKTEVRTTN
jgi:RecJ-like exonuclease